jgi:hypothetical protein
MFEDVEDPPAVVGDEKEPLPVGRVSGQASVEHLGTSRSAARFLDVLRFRRLMRRAPPRGEPSRNE